jgi:hypothetical protein
MKKILFAAVTTLMSVAAIAQSFEGTIEFKWKKATDTTNYVYYIKGDKVKIDNIGTKSKKVEGSFIIDTKAATMTTVSHDRKLYSTQDPTPPNKPNGTCEVITTKNTKTIQGYKCVEIIVKNKDENTQISYWVAKAKFDFFDVLLKTLNRKDKFALYYLQIPNSKGWFPVLAVMSGLDGMEKERLEATKIEKKAVDVKMFDIPSGYMKFEK